MDLNPIAIQAHWRANITLVPCLLADMACPHISRLAGLQYNEIRGTKPVLRLSATTENDVHHMQHYSVACLLGVAAKLFGDTDTQGLCGLNGTAVARALRAALLILLASRCAAGSRRRGLQT